MKDAFACSASTAALTGPLLLAQCTWYGTVSYENGGSELAVGIGASAKLSASSGCIDMAIVKLYCTVSRAELLAVTVQKCPA